MLLFQGCKKGFLDEKPNVKLVIPTTLEDFRVLLDNSGIMNRIPALPIICSDDFFTSDDGYQALVLDMERNAYTWKREIYGGDPILDWSTLFTAILYANIVLEGLEKIDPNPAQQSQWDELKGTALFFRALAYSNLIDTFSPPYNSATSSTDLGMPLHLAANVNDRPKRASVEETYQQIITDLTAAEPLLPVVVSYKTRPSKAAAAGLLARIYQTMGNYEKAALYADQAVVLHNKPLINFSTLDKNSNSPFPSVLPNGNDEIIFYTNPVSYQFPANSLTEVVKPLYNSYAPNDLRKALFFRLRPNGLITYKGYKSGILIDEMYLISAESNARLGKVTESMGKLNALLKTRFDATYVPFTAQTPDEALSIVIVERRKELLGKHLRWRDLRRLNQEPQFAVTISRTVLGKVYELPPNDPRYTLKIPDDEILSSGMAQNP
ncbi:hypothetical protein N824_10620 [Pedobacter sp. V48]|nr:hypothetical protein N824_10620 [Pedobacter sp. V48]